MIMAYLADDDIRAATDLLKQHFLVINDSLPTLPTPARSSGRQERAFERNYAEIFHQGYMT